MNHLKSHPKTTTRAKLWLATLSCGLAVLALTAAPVHAAPPTASEVDFYNLNGILYYNPNGIDNCVIGVGSYNGEASAGLSPTQAGFVDAYYEIAAQLSVEYGIPWETVMAQGILESAAGTSHFATERNNFFGIGAFDSNPDNAFRYETPEAGWRGYFENIRKTPTYRNHGVFQGNNITDPYAYLTTIKAAGYATDPNYISKVSQFIAAVTNRAQEQGWKTTAELATENPEIFTNAERYAGGGEVSDTMQSYVGSACLVQYGRPSVDNSTEGSTDNTETINRGNGSINETALNLAWANDSGQHSKYDAKQSYKDALVATGISKYNDQWVQIGASCDAFVATVMRYSGLDPKFPCCKVQYNNFSETGSIHKYLAENTSKYKNVGSGSSSANAQPGDIRIREGHIEIVVQLPNGKLGIASASYNHRTAGVSKGWYVENNRKTGKPYEYQLYRFIGDNSNSKNEVTKY